MDMTIGQWIDMIELGAIVGAAGQGVRIVVGMKKLNDIASAQATHVRDLLVPSQIGVS